MLPTGNRVAWIFPQQISAEPTSQWHGKARHYSAFPLPVSWQDKRQSSGSSGRQCETCSNECNYTTDIDHAKNFNKEFGVYVEKENDYAENQ